MMRNGGQQISAPESPLSATDATPHLTSAQHLRRHAHDLIEAAERLLAQAEAELEMAYEMLSGGGSLEPTAEHGQP